VKVFDIEVVINDRIKFSFVDKFEVLEIFYMSFDEISEMCIESVD